MTNDPLANLPRLGAETLGPCVFCTTPMLQSQMPFFYRLEIKSCGIDLNEIRAHAGLAAMYGGGEKAMAIAGAIGAHREPVVVMGNAIVNVCAKCAGERLDVGQITAAALEDSE